MLTKHIKIIFIELLTDSIQLNFSTILIWSGKLFYTKRRKYYLPFLKSFNETFTQLKENPN